MDISLIKPYSDALSAQKSQLDSYLTRGFQDIAVPANHDEVAMAKRDMLTVSAGWFIGIGIVGFIIGLIVSGLGIVIAGFTAIFSGCYLYVKGRQAIRHDAYARLGQSVYGQIEKVVENIRSQWSGFMTKQNDALKTAVVGADAPDSSAKVAIIDKIDTTPELSVDMASIQSNLDKISAEEDLADYRAYLPKAQAVVAASIQQAGTAQQAIYADLAGK